MKAVSIATSKKIDRIIAAALVGGKTSGKLDRAPGAYMALSVEKIGEIAEGPIFSFCHYAEQNGDLVQDPEMTFFKGYDGKYYPMTFQQGFTGYYQEAVICKDGKVHGFRPRASADQASFLTTWVNNIIAQQGIK